MEDDRVELPLSIDLVGRCNWIKMNAYEIDLEEKIQRGVFPLIIYKFRRWNNEPKDHIIRNRTIRLASPSEMLADYPEAFLPIDETLINEEYLQKIALHTAKQQHPDKPTSYQNMIAKQLRRDMKIEDPEHRKQWEVRAKQRNDETMGIFCASMTFEDMYLWNNFGGQGTGFAVGLDIRKIILHSDIDGRAGIVDYYPDGNPPKVPPFSFSLQESVDKSMMEMFNIPKKYEQEKEFRIARTNRKRTAEGRIAKYTEKDRIILLNVDCYREIVLGYDISEEDQNEIVIIRNNELKGVPIYATKVENNIVIKSHQL